MNRFCALTGCSLPVQQAAMSRMATPALAAAVSEAGGLGMLAVGRMRPEQVARDIDATLALTARPFGVGFIVHFLDRANLELAAARVPIVELFYGWPDETLVPGGVIVGWQIGSLDEAKAAVDAGCRYVVAQGVEAGGHVRGTAPLATLVPAVRAALDVPIVAAGGIGSAAEVRAALALGADAVRIGTRLLAADEADVHPVYVDRLIAADADDTAYTEVFDVGWENAPHRVLRSSIDAVLARDDAEPVGHVGAAALVRRSPTPPNRATTGNIDAMALYAGRSVGALTERASAAEIIDELMAH